MTTSAVCVWVRMCLCVCQHPALRVHVNAFMHMCMHAHMCVLSMCEHASFPLDARKSAGSEPLLSHVRRFGIPLPLAQSLHARAAFWGVLRLPSQATEQPSLPSLASLACYNEAGMPGMQECILPHPPPHPDTLLSTSRVSPIRPCTPPHTKFHHPHTSRPHRPQSLLHIYLPPPPLFFSHPPRQISLSYHQMSTSVCLSFLTYRVSQKSSWDVVPIAERYDPSPPLAIQYTQ